MSLSRKGITVEDTKLSATSKATSLNPNAAEFVPGSFRLSSGSGTVVATQESHETSPFGKAVLDHSDSSVSKNSDDEAHQYWRHQLPDDITPDFQVTGEEGSHGLGNLSLSELSLNDGGETSRFSASVGRQYPLNEWGESSPTHNNGNRFSEKSRHSIQPYGEESLYLNFLHSTSKPWEKRFVRNDSLSSNYDAMPHNFNSEQSFLNDMFGEKVMLDNANANMDPVEFLASQFPGFATKSLAEVYLANGCDLNLTIEMLSQLELQVDGSFRQNISPKTLSAPNLSSLDFPALPVPDDQNCVPKFSRDNAHENFNLYQSSEKDDTLFKMNSSIPSRSTSDFASIVKKSHRNPSAWKDDRSRTPSASNDPNRSILAGSYSSVNGRGMYGDKLQSRGSARAAPLWVETGDAVENMYYELRGEARDYARIRNVYFEQATQAYLIGNKALAKELSMKGQLHNMQMKAAHGKAQESIYRQRNPVGRGQEKLIDLHGLHVTEAIHVLKQELSKLRSVARSAEQRMAVYICVGTGHHTRGSRTPARLPAAVQHYLLEDEGLDFSEPQPGLLLVVIY